MLLEIFARYGSYVLNKWPGLEIAEQREDILSSRLVPCSFISTPPPCFLTPNFNAFSLEIKVSSCLCTSFRFLAPLANYSICLLQRDFIQFPDYSQCPNLITYFMVSVLAANDDTHTFARDFPWLWRKATSLT